MVGDGIPLRIQVGRTVPLKDHVSTMLAQMSLKLDKPTSTILFLEPRESNITLLFEELIDNFWIFLHHIDIIVLIIRDRKTPILKYVKETQTEHILKGQTKFV